MLMNSSEPHMHISKISRKLSRHLSSLKHKVCMLM